MADKDKKVVVPSSADSTIQPSDVTRIAPAAQGSVEQKKLKTIKLKPLKTVAPATSQNDEETISMKRESSSSESELPSTNEDATVGINRGGTSKTVLAPPMPEDSTGSPEDDATVKIEKVSKQQQGPSVAPAIPGVKQTIKLRPSSSVSDATAPVATQQPASKQTLKLTPTASPVPSAPSQQEQEPEKMPESGSVGSTKKTIKLVAKKPSAPTVKLDSPASAPTISTPPEDAAPSSSKRTLKIKTTSMPPPPSPAQSDMGMATEHGAPPVAEPSQVASSQQYAQQMQEQQADDAPSTLNAIAASISLLALAYFAYQLFSQYKGMFM